jgi:hypothetical protein
MKVLGKNGKNAPDIREAMRSADDVRKLARTDPPAALAAAEAQLAPKTARLDEIYDVAQEATKGVPLQEPLAALGKVKEKYSSVAEEPLAKAVDDLASRLVEKFDNGPVPLQTLREEIAAWQRTGYSGNSVIDRSAKKGFDIEIANALRGALNKEVERVATANPGLGIKPQELQATNKQVSTWLGITRLLEEKATRGAAGAATLSDLVPKNALKQAVSAVTGAAGEAVDPIFAKLVLAAKKGDGKAAETVKQIYETARKAATANSAEVLPDMAAQLRPAGAY